LIPTTNNINLPFYARATLLLVGIFALFAILFICRSILVPLVFAAIFAIVLSPVVNFFVKLRFNRILAITVTLVLAFSIIAAVGTLLLAQLSKFSDSWPLFVERATEILNQSILKASEYLDIRPQKVHAWIDSTKAELLSGSTAAIGHTLSILGSFVVALLLVPVYIFLILLYQPLLLEFINKLFYRSSHTKVGEVITQIKSVVQAYLLGLIFETIIVAALQTTTLLILGIQYALLLGIVGALLNLIPYIGGIVAVALPMMLALVTEATAWPALYILIVYYAIQLVDNNYVVPRIVASKVKINALFSIIVVFVGNALWGVPGMFISIPMLAIVKLIFDHIEVMKPWGFLLGDTMPTPKIIPPLIKAISKMRKNAVK
jgi:predicted PurR-regulated permease PerM